MHMENGLAGASAGIEDEPEVAIGVLAGNAAGGCGHMREKFWILREFPHVTQVSAGNDEGVQGCLRMEVLEDDHLVVFMQTFRRDLPRHDFAEDAFGIAAGAQHRRGRGVLGVHALQSTVPARGCSGGVRPVTTPNHRAQSQGRITVPNHRAR